MANVTMEELQKKAAELVKMMERVANEADPEKFAAIAREIEAEAKKFEQLGAAYVQEARKQVRPMTTVVLTPDQRKRIQAKTGITMETIDLPDDAARTSKLMPVTRTELIEHLALEEAKRRKAAAEAAAKAMVEVDKALANIDNLNIAALTEQLEEKRKDPKFLAGLLYKGK
jgi:hypothetical protein